MLSVEEMVVILKVLSSMLLLLQSFRGPIAGMSSSSGSMMLLIVFLFRAFSTAISSSSAMTGVHAEFVVFGSDEPSLAI